MIRDKEEPIVADAPPEHPFPFLAAQGFYIALERVGFHLCDYARHALLNGFGKFAKVLLCVFG
jgi:hypothetical protein